MRCTAMVWKCNPRAHVMAPHLTLVRFIPWALMPSRWNTHQIYPSPPFYSHHRFIEMTMDDLGYIFTRPKPWRSSTRHLFEFVGLSWLVWLLAAEGCDVSKRKRTKGKEAVKWMGWDLGETGMKDVWFPHELDMFVPEWSTNVWACIHTYHTTPLPFPEVEVRRHKMLLFISQDGFIHFPLFFFFFPFSFVQK